MWTVPSGWMDRSSTGDPVFAVPSSVLGTPSISLPVLEADGLPLGLQVMGYANEDAATMSAARAVLALYSDE